MMSLVYLLIFLPSATVTNAAPVLEVDSGATPMRVIVRSGDAVLASPEEGL